MNDSFIKYIPLSGPSFFLLVINKYFSNKKTRLSFTAPRCCESLTPKVSYSANTG